MKRSQTLIFFSFLSFFLLSQEVATAQDITGFWNGKAELMGQVLRVEFDLTGTNESLGGVFRSPDQGSGSSEITGGYFRNDSLVLEVADLTLQFVGRFDKTSGIIPGKMIQRGAEYPMFLQREPLAAEKVNRPQTPIPPFPYYTEEVTFQNEVKGLELAGTITIPRDTLRAVVVFISGSGKQDRNSEILGHKPFLVWADHLARQGIASLRYDDRGAGGSEGVYMMATSIDLAGDALSGVHFLREDQRFASTPVGLIGHSEGGLIAAIAASQDSLDFIVSLAGLGVSGAEVLEAQSYDIAIAEGAGEVMARAQQDQTKQLNALLLDAKGDSLVLANGIKAYAGTDVAVFEQLNTALNNRWMRQFISLRGSDYFEKVSCPVLALNGNRDSQVAAGPNLNAIEFAARRAGNKKVKTMVLKDHNHLFQQTESGSISMYGKLEETVSEETLNIVSDWITNTVSK